jgi:CelD/BcsL family acetyltransferase involved in cellulose biosynthesis
MTPRLEVRTELGDFASAWDDLVATSALPSPFLRSWWLESVDRGHPRFLLVVDAGELLGGLALDRRRFAGIEVLTALGAGGLYPDHYDLVATPTGMEVVQSELARWLRRGPQRIVDLDGVAVGANVGAALGHARTRTVDVAPWEPLPKDFAAYLSSRPKRLRKNIRQGRRRAATHDLRWEVLRADQSAEAIAALRRLHAALFGRRSAFLPHIERFARAAGRGAARGEVEFHVYRAPAGEIVAIKIAFTVAGRISFYQGGRDPDDPRTNGLGTALLSHAVERACQRGVAEMDLLRGDEPYKHDWAAHRRPVLRMGAAYGPAAVQLERAAAGGRWLRTRAAAAIRSVPGVRR